MGKYDISTKINHYPPRPSHSIAYQRGDVLGELLVLSDKKSGVEPGAVVVFIEDIFDLQLKCMETFSQQQIKEHVEHLPEFAQRAATEIKAMLKDPIQRDKVKVYLVKQDYPEAEKVAPPRHRLEKTNAIQSLPTGFRRPASALFSFFRLNDRDSENFNVLLEVAANSIAADYGMPTQKQSPLFALYADGHPKILSISEWEHGLISVENCLAGSRQSNHYHNYIVQCQRDDNGKLIKVDRKVQFIRDEQGNYQLDNSIKGLAQEYAIALLMGDRDYWGSKLQNKAIKDGRLFGYDFGHAFRKNPFVDSLTDDFHFIQPSAGDEIFKNASVFTDACLSEKMKGVYYIFLGLSLDARDELFTPEQIQKILFAIEEYKKTDPEFAQRAVAIQPRVIERNFTELCLLCQKKAQDESLPLATREKYASYIDNLLEHMNKALSYEKKMMSVFAQRMELNPVDVDCLDNLEKFFCYQVSKYSPDGKVALNHLQVLDINSKKTVQWQMRHTQDGHIVLEGMVGEVLDYNILMPAETKLKMLLDFKRLLLSMGIKKKNVKIINDLPNNRVSYTIEMTPAIYQRFLNRFTEAFVYSYKARTASTAMSVESHDQKAPKTTTTESTLMESDLPLTNSTPFWTERSAELKIVKRRESAEVPPLNRGPNAAP